MAVINIRDVVGKLSRVEEGCYRVGIYGNKDVLEALQDIEAYDRLTKFDEKGGHKPTLSDLRKIGIKIIDLSKEPVDEYGYQCDLVVADFSLENDSNPEHQTKIQEILEANAPKFENNEMVRQNAPIIALYDKSKFQNAEEVKNFRAGINERLSLYAPPHFVVGFDEDMSDLAESMIPAIIENDVFDSKAVLELEKSKNLDASIMVDRLAQMITYAFESKNPYTKGHSERVAIIAQMAASGMRFSKEEFAEKFPDLDFDSVTQKFDKDSEIEGKDIYGFNDKYLDLVGAIATAHDIGKIGIPNIILDKPSGLSDQEFEIMKQHSKIGEMFFRYLSNTDERMKEVSLGVVDHHEKYNGRGYPNGKKGNQISTVGRIISLADAFDAMTTTRSYNNPKDFESAIIDICQNSGGQFDPDVVYGMARSLCKECTFEIPGYNDKIKNGLITSKESFDLLCSKEMLNYNYSTPPLYDENGKEVKDRKENARHDYVPDSIVLKEFADKFLADRESFDKFVATAQIIGKVQDNVMPTRRKLNDKKDKDGLTPEENELLERANKAFKSIIGIKFRDYFDKSLITEKAAEINDIMSGKEPKKDNIEI